MLLVNDTHIRGMRTTSSDLVLRPLRSKPEGGGKELGARKQSTVSCIPGTLGSVVNKGGNRLCRFFCNCLSRYSVLSRRPASYRSSPSQSYPLNTTSRIPPWSQTGPWKPKGRRHNCPFPQSHVPSTCSRRVTSNTSSKAH